MKKRQPKFRRGQMVCIRGRERDCYGRRISRIFSTPRGWNYWITGAYPARPEKELRPLTKREAGR